jgi:MFS family permease
MSGKIISKRAHRWAVATFFFLAGLCFSSWASRIPDLKAKMHFDDAGLGGVLFALPLGSMICLLFSGWLVNRFGSRNLLIVASVGYPLVLILIGVANSVWTLVPIILLFGTMGNLCNISINTQAVGVEKLYSKSIMASFHGIWSLAGFTGAALGTFLISVNMLPVYHFSIVAGISIVSIIYIQQFSLKADPPVTSQSFFVKPDRLLIQLGLIAFSCMACEGTMFDWSGVYFQKVVEAPKGLITLGYAAFMGTMAGGRFIGDWLVNKIGKQKVLQFSGIIITLGLLVSVLLPTLISATIGFLLVGLGVSSVVPLVYSTAGKSTTLSPGLALTAVSSIGFLGFLLGPPLIGFIAQAFSLRLSFSVIAILGLGTTFLATKIKSW